MHYILSTKDFVMLQQAWRVHKCHFVVIKSIYNPPKVKYVLWFLFVIKAFLTFFRLLGLIRHTKVTGILLLSKTDQTMMNWEIGKLSANLNQNCTEVCPPHASAKTLKLKIKILSSNNELATSVLFFLLSLFISFHQHKNKLLPNKNYWLIIGKAMAVGECDIHAFERPNSRHRRLWIRGL